ncbi:MAG: hypothetical protein MR327_03330, partial [Clostridiales bacterium]|nr:hypothetical protein [Clostridiales bacterium]
HNRGSNVHQHLANALASEEIAVRADAFHVRPSSVSVGVFFLYWRIISGGGSSRQDGGRPNFQAVEKVLPPKGFGGKDRWKGNRQGSLSLKSTTF